MTTRCRQCGTPSPILGAERSLCQRCAPLTRAGSTNPTPADPESSGIIDVRAMLAILGDEGGAASEAPAQAQARRRIPTPLPSALPMIQPPRPVAAASRSKIMSSRTHGWRPLTGVALGLAVALVGLTGYAVAKQPLASPSALVEVREVRVPAVTGDATDPESDAAGPVDAARDEAAAPDEPAPPAAETEATTLATPRRPARAPRRPARGASGEAPSGSTPQDPATPARSPASPAPTADKPDETSVDCLLEPKKCASKPTPTAEPSAPTPTASKLPAKLEASEITEGVRAAKSAAASKCSGLAKDGETVRLKISIAGATGTVVSTKVEEGRAELGACCARELAKATFPKVQKEQTGAVVTVRF